MPTTITSAWKPRTQQIFPAEAVALPVATWMSKDFIKGKDVVWFIDNEAVAAAAIRGSSGEEDVSTMVQATHLLWMHLGCRVWIEWVDSLSNPADGLSRGGLSDPWTLQQEWQLAESPVPPWGLEPGRPDNLFNSLKGHWG